MNVEFRNIDKAFGSVRANKDINLFIPSGTIQGILGENGAGKSTLMKILSGFIHADRGEILLNGNPISIKSPADAIRQGVGMLHQDPLDFPPMKVLDNFLLGHLGGLIPDWESTRQQFVELTRQYGFALDPDAYVDSLTVGERQQLEIVRLLWLGVSVLILDEPTTGISSSQKIKLFETLRLLTDQGKTVIFVSHKLEDVEQLCNRVVVMRQGFIAGEMSAPYSTKDLVSAMFGKEINLGGRQKIHIGQPVLSLERVAVEDNRLIIQGVNLHVRAGEVIGIAGMEGSGQDTFLKACAGLVRTVSGKVIVAQKNLTGKSHLEFKRHGVAYMPAARLEQGLIPGLTLKDHFTLAEKAPGIFIDNARSLDMALERIAAFNIKGTPNNPVELLSGGNQQRALLALLPEPLSLILLEHPSRGLDIESTIYIWTKLKERCRQGASILFISSDLDEILQYSDRLLVFFSGRVSKPLEATKTTVDQLGQLIGGKGWDKVEA
jgi:general nucleoside transport system ATP-binding protein